MFGLLVYRFVQGTRDVLNYVVFSLIPKKISSSICSKPKKPFIMKVVTSKSTITLSPNIFYLIYSPIKYMYNCYTSDIVDPRWRSMRRVPGSVGGIGPFPTSTCAPRATLHANTRTTRDAATPGHVGLWQAPLPATWRFLGRPPRSPWHQAADS